MITLNEFAQMIEYGKLSEIPRAVQMLLYIGTPVPVIAREGIIAGLSEVGRKFAAQEYFLPEMLLAARAAKLAEQTLVTYGGQAGPQFSEKVLLGTVKNDLHDIGKNLVKMAMENARLCVVDLGVDVSAEQFVQAVEADEDIAFVGISALLTTTLPDMAKTVKALKSCSASDRLTILVGGAPVTAKFAKKIGADIYTDNAFEATSVVRQMLEDREVENVPIQNHDPAG